MEARHGRRGVIRFELDRRRAFLVFLALVVSWGVFFGLGERTGRWLAGVPTVEEQPRVQDGPSVPTPPARQPSNVAPPQAAGGLSPEEQAQIDMAKALNKEAYGRALTPEPTSGKGAVPPPEPTPSAPVSPSAVASASAAGSPGRSPSPAPSQVAAAATAGPQARGPVPTPTPESVTPQQTPVAVAAARPAPTMSASAKATPTASPKASPAVPALPAASTPAPVVAKPTAPAASPTPWAAASAASGPSAEAGTPLRPSAWATPSPTPPRPTSAPAVVAPPAPLPTPAQEPVAPPGNAGYTVQVGSVRTRADADVISKQLVAHGYNPFVQEYLWKGERWFRVRVGHFTTKEEAQSLAFTLINLERLKDSRVMREP